MREIKVGFATLEVKKAFEELNVGKNIPKNLIPKEYIRRFGIDNLRKYDLPNA